MSSTGEVEPLDDPPIRDHRAFLNGYAPEDEGLYEDAQPVSSG